MPFPLAELVAGDITRAAAYLAARREVVRTEGLPWAEKRANGLSDVLSGLGQSVTSNPVLGKALLGGGLGALAGAGSHYLGGDEADPRAKRRGVLSSALTGGLAGAALGGGLGMVQRHLPGGGGHGRGPGPAGGTPGVGEFTHNGTRYRIDPETLRNNPELLERALHASSGPNALESLPGAALYGLWNNPVAPWSGRILPVVGAADWLHTRGRHHVEDLQSGLSSLMEKAKNRPEIQANLGAMSHLVGSEQALRETLHGGPGGNRVANFFRRAFGGPRTAHTPGDMPQMHDVTQTELQSVVDPATGNITHGKPTSVTRSKPVMEQMPHGHFGPAAPRPVQQSVSRDLAREGSRIGRTARLGQKLNLPRLGLRGMIYGGIPLTEWALNTYGRELGKTQDLQEMLRQHARPIGPAQ